MDVFRTSIWVLALAYMSMNLVLANNEVLVAEPSEIAFENRFHMSIPQQIPKSKAFSRYSYFVVPDPLITEILKSDHYLLEHHFDPQSQKALKHELTSELLTKRGIKSLIGTGVSDFSGSSDNRVHNLKETIRRMDGLIIAQGETFSFNAHLGAVSEESGFVWSKVIKDRQNQWGLGGGVCQVSSNVFRVALNTGLPITAWRAHSLPLDYYAPTGLDATIYKGQQDLQFKNDTPADVLMRFVIQDEKLITLIYGTSDGRSVELARTKHWVGGPMNIATEWTRTIKKGGETTIDVFEADYHPPQ